ncbi:hypothetical protein AB6A40_010676 [Gnathostoma spinigerum]|uniref:Uncharacterized protein n=1 Tax=Gnathostoma spinigerum TaxID=75299 RepID=A0ABD6EXZ6_9BILA
MFTRITEQETKTANDSLFPTGLALYSDNAGSNGASAEGNDVMNDNDYKAKVEEMITKIRIAINEKEAASHKLVLAVNEVKKLEMELDRTGLQCKELSQKLARVEQKHKALKETYEALDEQIKSIQASHRG